MIHSRRLAGLAALSTMLGVAGCHGDFLTGGPLSNNPNRPTVASEQNLFTTIQSNLWALWGSDPARVTGIYVQQYAGQNRQYQALDQTYAQDPTTTNGFHSTLYTAGGLVDIINLENEAKAANDSLYLGIAYVLEGATMGTGADLFGNLVYSQALKGTPNPQLDPQLAVYDSVQKVLSTGIQLLTTLKAGGVNAGPGAADPVYNGSPSKWAAMAYTLKARFYMHSVGSSHGRAPSGYANALAAAQKGIMDPANNYVGAFTGANVNQSNFYYQFYYQRGNDLGPGSTLDSILKARNDPRDTAYFSLSSKGALVDLSAQRQSATFAQPFVTADENTLIWAEAAYRLGDQATATTQLNKERARYGLPAITATGMALLNEILTEEYIADFGVGEEAWNLYKRTCTPNLVPHSSTVKIPGRLFYDAGEQQTNTNIPPAGQGINGYRNPVDTPAPTVSDGTGQKCLGE